jgi:hypothetical protein
MKRSQARENANIMNRRDRHQARQAGPAHRESMQKSVAWLSLASTLLLACNNPAPGADLAEAAGAAAALDQTGRACQLAERTASESPEQTRGLYTSHTASASYAASELPCGAALAGSYGVRVELDVYVQDEASASEHDPGRGRASVLLRAEIDRARDDASAEVTLQLCGLDLPARFAYASSSVTQLQLPNEIWDRSSMPVWKSRMHAENDQLQLEAFPVLLGIALREPGDAWPSFDQTPAFDCGMTECFPDHDGDGQPGLSFGVQTQGDVDDAPYPACADWQLRAPSTDNHAWSSTADTDASELLVGLRTALQLSPRFDATCTQADGYARAADIMTRALACELTDGQPCSPGQATVIDERAPIFHVLEAGETPPESFRDSRSFVNEALDRSPSAGGQVTLRRLPDAAANCKAVRATFAH